MRETRILPHRRVQPGSDSRSFLGHTWILSWRCHLRTSSRAAPSGRSPPRRTGPCRSATATSRTTSRGRSPPSAGAASLHRLATRRRAPRKSSVMRSTNASEPPTSPISGMSRTMLPRPGVRSVVRVQLAERVAKAGRRVLDGAPRRRLRGPGDAHPVLGAGAQQRRHVREVVVDGVALNARPLGDRADRRLGRPDRPVQLEGRLGDALAHRVELLTPSSHPVGAWTRWFLLPSHVHRKY